MRAAISFHFIPFFLSLSQLISAFFFPVQLLLLLLLWIGIFSWGGGEEEEVAMVSAPVLGFSSDE